MSQSYARALRVTGPKLAAETSGVAVDGYWIDDNRLYFLAERMEPSLGRMVAVPSIADCNSNKVEEVIPLDALASLLREHSGQPLDLEQLSSAEFDMPDCDSLAVSLGGKDYLIDPNSRRILAVAASLDRPALYSPDGRYACFVRGSDLWLRERNSGAERPLTEDGAANYCYGQESETDASVLAYRERKHPVGLWSSDSQWFLTHRIDERLLPDFALVQHVPPAGGRPVLHQYKYPIPGDPLPSAVYLAIHIASGRVVTFDDFPVPITSFSPFSVRRAWFGARDMVWFVYMDRYCKQATLVSLDLATGTGEIVLSEAAASGYLDLNPFILATPNVRTLKKSDEIIWFSERDGWGHLYLYDALTGQLKNRITSGSWVIRDIVRVDEERRKVLLLAGGIDPTSDPARRSLCSVNLDGSEFEVLIAHEGDIYVPVTEPCGRDQDRPFRPSNAPSGISPDGRFGLVRYGSVERGNLTQIANLRKGGGFTVAAALPAADEAAPRHFTSLAADGVTQLHGVMFFPSDFDETRRYPLIDYIYPGPQLAHQPQSFHSVNSAQAMALAELGFIAMMLDTRGTPVGSRSFHQVGYGELLEPHLADHAAVVRDLCMQHSFVDADRIGIIGYSAGGAAAARALFDYGDVFKVGVSGCGNHDSSLLRAMWSDKYRGPDGGERWAEQSNAAAAYKLQGKLLLFTGATDDNVPISHTFLLVDALIRANKDFDLLVVPNEGHLLMMTCGYVQRRVWDYFVRHLLGEEPPAHFAIEFAPHELAAFGRNFIRELRQ
jgi:dipeptidyl-peptidase-4